MSYAATPGVITMIILKSVIMYICIYVITYENKYLSIYISIIKHRAFFLNLNRGHITYDYVRDSHATSHGDASTSCLLYVTTNKT